jgi:hypothetical protein
MSTTACQSVLMLAAPWGDEQLLLYRQKIYVCTGKYPDIDQAVALTKSDRQVGFDSIMIFDQDIASVWCALPSHLQKNLASWETRTEFRQIAEMLSFMPIEKRSWLDLVRLLSDQPEPETAA